MRAGLVVLVALIVSITAVQVEKRGTETNDASDAGTLTNQRAHRHHHHHHHRPRARHDDPEQKQHNFRARAAYHVVNRVYNDYRMARMAFEEGHRGQLTRERDAEYERMRGTAQAGLADFPKPKAVQRSNVFDLTPGNPIAPGTTAFAATVHVPAVWPTPGGKVQRCYIASTITAPTDETQLTTFIRTIAEQGFQSSGAIVAARNADQSVQEANSRLGFLINGNFYLDLPTEVAAGVADNGMNNNRNVLNYQALYNAKVARLNLMFDWFQNAYGGAMPKAGVGNLGVIDRGMGNTAVDIHLSSIGSAWLVNVIADANYANIPKLAGAGGFYPQVNNGASFPWETLLGAIEDDMTRATPNEIFITPAVRAIGKLLAGPRNTFQLREDFRRWVPYGALRNENLASPALTAMLTSMNAKCTEVWIHSIDSDTNGMMDAAGEGIYTRYDQLLAANAAAIYAVGGIQLTISGNNPNTAAYNANVQGITNSLFEMDRKVKHAMGQQASGLLMLPQEPNFVLKCPGANPPTSPLERFQVVVPEGAGIRSDLLAPAGRLDGAAAGGGVGVAAWYRARALWDETCYIQSETPERFLEQTRLNLAGQGGAPNTFNAGKIQTWRTRDIGTHFTNMDQLTMGSTDIGAAAANFLERVMGNGGWGANFGKAKTAFRDVSRYFSVRTYEGTVCNAGAGANWETELVTAITQVGMPLQSPYEGWVAGQPLAVIAPWAMGANPYAGAAVDVAWKQWIGAVAANTQLGDMDSAIRQAILNGNSRVQTELRGWLGVAGVGALCNAKAGPAVPGLW